MYEQAPRLAEVGAPARGSWSACTAPTCSLCWRTGCRRGGPDGTPLKARKAELFANVIDEGNAFGGSLDADDIRGLLA